VSPARRVVLAIVLGLSGLVVVAAVVVGLFFLVIVAGVNESQQGGDYVGTWAGTTPDGTAFRLRVEKTGAGWPESYVVYDPTDPASSRCRTDEYDPEELGYVPVSPDPTGAIGHGFDLRDQGGGGLTLEYYEDIETGEATTIKLTRVE
jgi:hypothetical protein